MDGGEVTLEDREIKLSISAWRWWRIVGMYGSGIGFIV